MMDISNIYDILLFSIMDMMDIDNTYIFSIPIIIHYTVGKTRINNPQHHK